MLLQSGWDMAVQVQGRNRLQRAERVQSLNQDALQRHGMRKSTRIVMICVIVGIGAIAGWFAWSQLRTPSEASDPVAYWEFRGQRVYNRFEATTDPAKMRESILQAPVEDPENLLRGDDAMRIRESVSEFLLARIGADSPEEYIAWMESRGYRFKNLEEFERDNGPIEWLLNELGLEPTASLREVFDALWEYPPSQRARISGICVGDGAMLVTVGHGVKHRPMSRRPEGRLGMMLWVGMSSSACRSWLRPPVTRDEIVERDGSVRTALVSLIAHVPGSGRRPLHVALFHDPVEDQWWIDMIAVNNYSGTSDAWTCMEF